MSLYDYIDEYRADQDEKLSSLLSLLGGLDSPQNGSTGFSGPGMAPSGPTGDSSLWENKARRMALNRYDYTRPEWRALDSIIERESGWDPTAVNPSSGAYGIPQIMPSAHGSALKGDPMGQLRWLFNYIENRYGDPMQALQFKNEQGWY